MPAKKNQPIAAKHVWLLAIAALVLSIAIFTLAVLPAMAQEGLLAGKSVCLDPGHGGSDPGAVYDGGTIPLEEADINLDVAYGLKALLEGQGAVVSMTRTDDSYLTNNDRYTYCNGQGSTILVSLHTNSSTNPNLDGSMALYFHNDDRELAQAIYDVMFPYLKDTAPDPGNFTGFGLDRFASGVLLKSDMPSTITEPVLMSNPAEAAELAIPIDGGACVELACRRGEIVRAIYDGLLNYFGSVDVNAPPSVTITSPADDALFNSGESIPFAGLASDDEDGDLTAGLVWTSSLDGQVGAGSSFNVVLSDGAHTITAEVTDSGGQAGSDSITIIVGDGGGSDITLSVITYKNRGNNYADLAWSGATSTDVDIFRDGSLVVTTRNGEAYTDGPLGRGGGSAVYQACEAGTRTCSNQVAVDF